MPHLNPGVWFLFSSSSPIAQQTGGWPAAGDRFMPPPITTAIMDAREKKVSVTGNRSLPVRCLRTLRVRPEDRPNIGHLMSSKVVVISVAVPSFGLVISATSASPTQYS